MDHSSQELRNAPINSKTEWYSTIYENQHSHCLSHHVQIFQWEKDWYTLRNSEKN